MKTVKVHRYGTVTSQTMRHPTVGEQYFYTTVQKPLLHTLTSQAMLQAMVEVLYTQTSMRITEYWPILDSSEILHMLVTVGEYTGTEIRVTSHGVSLNIIWRKVQPVRIQVLVVESPSPVSIPMQPIVNSDITMLTLMREVV